MCACVCACVQTFAGAITCTLHELNILNIFNNKVNDEDAHYWL